MKGLNFSVMNLHSNLAIICCLESAVLKLPHTHGMKFGFKIRSMLEKSKSSMPNTKKELKAMKSLRHYKDTRILTKAVAQKH